jgi:hypothetical protein
VSGRIESRNNKRGGFLDADMLRSGVREQYAVQRSYGTVVVELYHDRGWRVSERVSNGETATATDAAFATLDESRREYRRLVRKHR